MNKLIDRAVRFVTESPYFPLLMGIVLGMFIISIGILLALR